MEQSFSLKKENIVDFYVYILLGPSIFLWHFLDRFKVIYALPFIFILMVFFYNLFKEKHTEVRIVFKNQHLIVLFGYLFICFVTIVLNISEIKWYGVIRDMLIFATPFMIYGFDLKFKLKHAQYLLIIAIMSYFSVVGLDSEFSIHLSLFTTSGAKNEFHAGVLFGLFLIAFVLKKRWFWIFISVLFILLASKRAIFLGLIPAFGLFYLFIKPLKLFEKQNKWIMFLLLFVFYFGLYPISINLEAFSSWVLGLFTNNEVSSTNFLMKREVFVELLNKQIFSGDFVDFVFGHGPGQADLYLQNGLPGFMNYLLKFPINPHNEFCKLHYDLGFIGVIYFFFMAYTLYINNTKIGVILFLFTVPTFLVDNPLIFIYYTHIANVLINIDEFQDEKNIIST